MASVLRDEQTAAGNRDTAHGICKNRVKEEKKTGGTGNGGSRYRSDI
jgi:hypothetical protein